MKIPFARTFEGKDFGCIIDGSASSADYLNQRIVYFAVDYGFNLDDDAKKLLARFDYDVTKEDDSEMLNYLSDGAVEYLNDSELPSYSGFTVEDNSFFLMAYVDSAKEDVGFISSKSQDYPDDDYEGEWLHISDHGNATLYSRGIDSDGKIVDDEIWSVV